MFCFVLLNLFQQQVFLDSETSSERQYLKKGQKKPYFIKLTLVARMPISPDFKPY